MYKVSEFSKITSLTVKALHYYDQQGLLVPSFRDENNYRYYDGGDYEKAKQLILLKDMGFTIREMQEVFTHCESLEELPYYLKEKRQMLAADVVAQQAIIKKIDASLQPLEVEDMGIVGEVHVKVVPKIKVCSVRYRGRYQEVGNYFGPLYKKVKGKVVGVPFCCYYDGEFKEEADMELCIPVKEAVVGSWVLPAVKSISLLYRGSYEGIGTAYKRILDYGKEQGLKLELPSREVYHKGPGMIFRGNPQKYETEIIIPVEGVD